MRVRIAVFLLIFQSILGLAHWFIYRTWTDFRAIPDPRGITGTQAALALLAVSFVAASFLAFRYFNGFVRLFYTIAAVWLGMVNFLFLAACFCWIVYFGGSRNWLATRTSRSRCHGLQPCGLLRHLRSH